MDEKKSKSQMKREMTALQKLGEQLVDLSSDQIEKMEMPAELREAVLFAKTLKKHEARRRQLQYIGSVMRNIDPEPIRKAYENIALTQKLEVRLFKQAEGWRDALVEGNEEVLAGIFDRFPDADRQHLRQLVLNARKERETAKPPKSSRMIFRYLMELLKRADAAEG